MPTDILLSLFDVQGEHVVAAEDGQHKQVLSPKSVEAHYVCDDYHVLCGSIFDIMPDLAQLKQVDSSEDGNALWVHPVKRSLVHFKRVLSLRPLLDEF